MPIRMKAIKKQCYTCKSHDHDLDECHITSPVVLPDGSTKWPHVYETDWCDEWDWNQVTPEEIATDEDYLDLRRTEEDARI